MAVTEYAKKYHAKMFPGKISTLAVTDPEFIEFFDNFAFDEVVNLDDLDDHTRMLVILATLLGCQGVEEFRAMLPAALNFGVTPVEMKEIVYQANAYLGMGRVFPFLAIVNEVLTERGILLPLEGQSATTAETRLAAGVQAQVDIFGEGMQNFYQGGCEPQLQSHAAANIRIGNDKSFLIKVITQNLPFIGYPRSLNALTCVNKAADSMAKE